MNLLLLQPEDFAADGTARLQGRRLVHAREVLRAAAGDVLRVGLFQGNTGTAEVLHLDDSELVLRCQLTEAPPPRPGVDVLLALPRPKALRRILAIVASLGVDRLALVNAARVEKSYFASRVLAEAEQHLRAGLEQARDTVPPQILVRQRFRPFVEDELEKAFPPALRLLAHPAAAAKAPGTAGSRVVLAVGPEGGWVPFEVQLLEQRGFVPVTLGPRALRVEVALPYALGVLGAGTR